MQLATRSPDPLNQFLALAGQGQVCREEEEEREENRDHLLTERTTTPNTYTEPMPQRCLSVWPAKPP